MKNFMKEFIYLFRALIFWMIVVIKDYKNNPAAVEIESGKDIKKVCEKYGAYEGIKMGPEQLLDIKVYFEMKYNIYDIFEFLEERGVQFITVDHNKINRWYAAAFNPLANRIILTKGLGLTPVMYEALLVHEIQHAIQKHVFERFGFKDLLYNVLAVGCILKYKDYSLYHSLDFEQEAYEAQNEYTQINSL